MKTEGPELFLERPGLPLVQRSVVSAEDSLAGPPREVTGAPGPQVRGLMGRTSLQTPGAYRAQAPAGLGDFNSRLLDL